MSEMVHYTSVHAENLREDVVKSKPDTNCILRKYAKSRRAPTVGKKAESNLSFCSDLYPRGVDTSDYVIFGTRPNSPAKKRKTEESNPETETKKTKIDTTSLMNKLCVICYCRLASTNSPGSDSENPVVMTSCGHIFHEKCLNQWIVHQKICPCCRKDI